MTVTQDQLAGLASFVSGADYEAIPEAARQLAKRILLDCWGTSLAASGMDADCARLFDVLFQTGGLGACSVIGRRRQLNVLDAAFVNGALVHALNYDPVSASGGHVGVVALAAPLALGERAGVSGRALLTASAVACESVARVTSVVAAAGRRPSESFLSGQLLSYFGTTAGACKILELSPTAVESAFGLALMQMSGSRQVVLSGDASAKNIYGAFPNRGGVLSALLAESGVDGRCDVFGEPAGLYRAIYGAAFDTSPLTDGLGRTFRFLDAEFKPWPASNQVLPHVEAALDLSQRLAPAERIASIAIVCRSGVAAWCEPFDAKCDPQTGAAAANSIPYCVASALAHGRLDLDAFTAAGLHDPATRRLLALESYELDAASKEAVVRVTTVSGAELSASVELPVGHPSRPLDDRMLLEKFHDCCARSGLDLTPQRIDDLAGAILNLEKLKRVSELSALLRD